MENNIFKSKPILILILVLFLSFSVYSQSITIKLHNATIKESLSRIENKYPGLSFAYNENIKSLSKVVDKEYNNSTIDKVLSDLLLSENINYRYFDKKIVLYKKEKRERGRKITPKTNRVISGKIIDSSNGEPIVGATIFQQQSHLGTVSNEIGYFSMVLPQKSNDSIIVRCIGYNTKIILLKKDLSVYDIKLSPASFTTKEVTVKGKFNIMNVRNAQVGAHSLSPKEIEYLPSLGGEKDVIKAIQMLPGVTGGDEGNSSLVVRGGSPDQNLFLLDQVPIYNASHLLGLFSVFTPEAINRVDFFKAGFPSRYGGKLSSVVDISMKEGNKNHLTGDISIGTISSKGILEGPINKGKGTFIISARRTYLDLLAAPFMGKKTEEDKDSESEKVKQDKYKASFYDITGKLSYQLSPKTKLFYSLYYGNDVFSANTRNDSYGKDGSFNKSGTTADVNWGNFASSFRINQIHNSKLYSNFVVYVSNYNYFSKKGSLNNEKSSDSDETSTINSEEYSSRVTDYGVKYENHFNLSSKSKLICGMTGILHQFTPGEAVSIYGNSNNPNKIYLGGKKQSTKEGAMFVNLNYDPFKRLKLNLGLRYSMYNSSAKNWNLFEPRLALRYMLTDWMSFKASYDIMSQPVHLLSQNSFALGSSIWVPATKSHPAGKSSQMTIGTMININDYISFSMEGWIKNLDNQVELSNGFFENTVNWENQVTKGKGLAKGIDFLIRKQRGRTTGWISYTISENKRKYDKLNNGNWFSYKYDRTHDFKAVLQHKFNDRINFGLNYLLSSGYPMSIPTGYYTTSIMPMTHDKVLYYVPERNNKRMKMYHRLDCSITFSKKKKRGVRYWTFGVYNMYARKNAYNYYIDDTTYNGHTYVRIMEYSLYRFIPSITYRFKFN